MLFLCNFHYDFVELSFFLTRQRIFVSKPVLSITVAVVSNSFAVKSWLKYYRGVFFEASYCYVVSWRLNNGWLYLYSSGLIEMKTHTKWHSLSAVRTIQIQIIVFIDNKAQRNCKKNGEYRESLHKSTIK